MLHYFLILFIVITLVVFPRKDSTKANNLLIAFTLLTFFLSIRYNYGLDYEHYKDFFYYPNNRDRAYSEFLFWKFFFLFSRYQYFIIFHTIIWCGTLYYFCKKYILPRYYWLFLSVVILNNNLMFNYMSAFRSSIAACVVMWSIELFYLRRHLLLQLSIGIIVGSLFHFSTIFLLVFPVVELARTHLERKYFLLAGILCVFFGLTYTQDIALSILSFGGPSTDDFSGYVRENVLVNASYFSLILSTLMFLCIFLFFYNYNIYSEKCRKLCFLSYFWFVIFALHLDFEGRYSLYLYPFILLAHSQINSYNKKRIQYIITFCLVLYSLIRCYATFRGLALQPWLPGNMLEYHTIFEENNLTHI